MKEFEVLYKADSIARRVKEMGKEISHDFAGQTLDVVCLLDNAYVFVSDLVRALDVPVRAHFVRTEMQDTIDPSTGKERKEIFFTPEVDAEGRNVLLVEGVLQSGITTDFLLRRIILHRPLMVKIATFVDKPIDRKVLLEPDYYGVRLASNDIVIGYGLAWDGLHGNLPYLGTLKAGRRAKPAARVGIKGKKAAAKKVKKRKGARKKK